MSYVLSLIQNENSHISTVTAINRISLEASFATNLVNLLKGYLPAFINDLVVMSANMAKETNNIQIYKDFISKEHRVFYKIQNLDYMTFGHVLVSVPEGFSGSLNKYGELLIQCILLVRNRLPQLLGTLNSYMAQLISNTDHRTSMKDVSIYYKEADKERLDIIFKIGKFFPKNKTSITKAQLNTIISRMNDVKDFKLTMDKLNSEFNKLNLQELQGKVKESVDLSNMLLQYIKEDKIPIITPAVSKTISYGLHNSATYIELTSGVVFDTLVYMKAIDDLYNTILNA